MFPSIFLTNQPSLISLRDFKCQKFNMWPAPACMVQIDFNEYHDHFTNRMSFDYYENIEKDSPYVTYINFKNNSKK